MRVFDNLNNQYVCKVLRQWVFGVFIIVCCKNCIAQQSSTTAGWEEFWSRYALEARGVKRLSFATEYAPSLILLNPANARSLLDSLESEIRSLPLSQNQRIALYRLQLQVHSEFFEPEKAGQVARKLEKVLAQRNSLDFGLENLADVHLSLGDYFINFVSPDSAIYHFEKAQIYSESIGDSARIWSSLNKEASVYNRINAHDRVIQNHLTALNLSRAINDKEKELQSLHSLAGGYRDIGDYDRAETFYQEEIALCLKLGNELRLAFAFSNLGRSYNKSGQSSKAKLYTEKSLELIGKLGLEYDQTSLWIQLADCFITQGLLNDGEKALERGLEMASEQMFLEAQAQGTLLKHRLELAKGNVNLAEDQLLRVLAIVQEYPMPETEMLAYELAVDYYKHIGDFEQALNAQTQQNILERNLLKKQKDYQLLEQQAKFDALEKEKIIAETNRALISEKQRNWRITLASLVLVAMVLLISSMFLLLRKRKNELTAAYQLAKSQKAELESLNKTKDKFFSIIAHDLRSPMVALQGIGRKLEYFIKKDKQEKLLEIGGKIDQSIDQLNHLLNNLLSWAASQTDGIPYTPGQVSIKQLIDENIALFQSLAQSKSIDVVNEVEDVNVYVDVNTSCTVLRNVLSNAIKFSPERGKVVFSSATTLNKVDIMVSDNGLGMPSHQMDRVLRGESSSQLGTKGEKGFGLGLKLCVEFMHLNKGSVKIESKEGSGTRVVLTFPVMPAAIHRRLA